MLAVGDGVKRLRQPGAAQIRIGQGVVEGNFVDAGEMGFFVVARPNRQEENEDQPKKEGKDEESGVGLNADAVHHTSTGGGMPRELYPL